MEIINVQDIKRLLQDPNQRDTVYWPLFDACINAWIQFAQDTGFFSDVQSNTQFMGGTTQGYNTVHKEKLTTITRYGQDVSRSEKSPLIVTEYMWIDLGHKKEVAEGFRNYMQIKGVEHFLLPAAQKLHLLPEGSLEKDILDFYFFQ